MGDWDTSRTACDTLCIIADKRLKQKSHNDKIMEKEVTTLLHGASPILSPFSIFLSCLR